MGNLIDTYITNEIFALLHSLSKEETFTEAYQGWASYICNYVGYTPEAITTADDLLPDSFNKKRVEKEGDLSTPSLFICQTLYALLCKMIALECLPSSKNLDTTCPELLSKLEQGEPFRVMGIQNFPNSRVFSWYASHVDHRWDQVILKLLSFIRRMIAEGIKPSDLIAKLYLELFPGKVRHALGEFYTPPWLAQEILSEAQLVTAEDLKVVDPSCGSGVFLALLLKQFNGEALRCPIYGLELNPISVLAAKAAYITELRLTGDQFRIPVFQVDTTYFPYIENSLLGSELILNIGPIRFQIPSTEIDKRGHDILLSALDGIGQDALSENVVGEKILSQLSHIKNIFERELVIRQFCDTLEIFRFGKFDRVVGNPPWVNWEHLSPALRERIQSLFKYYGLLDEQVNVGALKVDISALTVYVAVDRLLRSGGILSFAITESLFKAKTMSGFRKFKLPDDQYLGIHTVHDLTKLQVFEGATNRTAVLVLKKGAPTIYPVQYIVWKPNRFSKDDGTGIIKKRLWAQPISGPTSPWIAATEEDLNVLSRIAGHQTYYRAREGINTGGGSSLFWMKLISVNDGTVIVQNEYNAGRKRAPKIDKIEMEAELLYPLIHGRHIRPWVVDVPDRFILIPHTKDTGMRAIPEDQLARQFPKTYSYLCSAEIKPLLERRRARLRWGHAIESWYSLFEIGEYTFAPFKVVYKGEVANKIVAAMVSSTDIAGIGKKLIMPDQTVHFIPCNNESEAMYLCALLNSTPIRLLYKAFGYKHPSTFFISALNFPRYDRTDDDHKIVSRLAKQLANRVSSACYDALLEHELDLVVGRVIGLTPEEVENCRKSLNLLE
jgi:hypothetical protein